MFLAVIGVVAPAHAAALSGNPQADGWTRLGNSLETGTWVQNSGPDGSDVCFDVYFTQFTAAGNTYLGLGGLVIGDIQNSSLEAVMKFATASATYQAASSVGAADGIGGDAPGGDGMILVRLSAALSNPAGFWRVTDAGLTFTNISAHAPDFLEYAITEEAGTYVQDWGAHPTLATDRLRSFEAVLNLTAIEAAYGVAPSIDGVSIVNMQGNYPGNYHYNEALAPVPEPASFALLFLAGGALLRRRIIH